LLRRILFVTLLLLGILGLTAVPASAATFTVNSTADDTDAGGCETSPGDCTLREAIVAANVDSTADSIHFDITPNTIAIGSPLPALTQQFTIDGTTDPDSTRVTLDGPTGTNANGLTVTISSATSSTVKGLIVTGFEGTGGDTGLGHGIFANTGTTTTLTLGGTGTNEGNVLSGNQAAGAFLRFGGVFVLRGNIIGLAEDGTTILANSQGTLVQGTNSIVGGTTGVTPGGSCTGACNLISGNTGTGLSLGTATQVIGNFIGTDVTGLLDRGNGSQGIGSGTSAAIEVIGGPSPQERNVISGNGNVGIGFGDSGQSNNVIQGNYIGVGSDGSTPLGNSLSGISLGADNNTIGGMTAGAGNVIASNGSAGIFVGINSNDNEIRGNSIHSNGALGIDLDPFGVNANDLGDPDTGANLRQNFPETLAAEVTGGVVAVEGSLNSAASTTFDIDVYSNAACNAMAPNDHGEGRTFLGSTTAVTDSGGNATFSFASSGSPPVSVGDIITATATDPNGNSSEFSKCRTTTGPQPDLAIDDVTVTEGNGGTVTAEFKVTRSGDLSGTSSVDFATANGTATAPGDYESNSASLSFAATDATKLVQIAVKGDVLDEPNETFAVNLSNAMGADIIDGSGQGTITDDDAPPPPPKCPGFEGDPRPQLVGTEGNDTLIGTGAAEILCGLGGKDVFKGGGAKDLVLGGGGNDRLAGQGGKDVLKGQTGNDKMNGGPGVDRCRGGPGKDVARACEKGKA
jgi:CSLREA domain-containing protein